MVNVTDRAREQLKAVLDDVVDEPGVPLRLAHTTQGLAIFADSRKDDDMVVEHNGEPVLLIDRAVAEALDGRTIDVEETTEGVRLTVRR